jgi:hypothetical protein
MTAGGSQQSLRLFLVLVSFKAKNKKLKKMENEKIAYYQKKM